MKKSENWRSVGNAHLGSAAHGRTSNDVLLPHFEPPARRQIRNRTTRNWSSAKVRPAYGATLGKVVW